MESCDLNEDPTAHAEVMAIRQACRRLKEFQLKDCDLYASREPCPMCLAAIYWARLRRVFYATAHKDAASIGFDDDFIYREIRRPVSRRKIPMKQLLRNEAIEAFVEWKRKADRTVY